MVRPDSVHGCKRPGDVANVRPSMVGVLTRKQSIGSNSGLPPPQHRSGLCPGRRGAECAKTKICRLSENAEYSGYEGVDDAQGYGPSLDGAEHGGAHE